jgi:hypothetical protein
MRGMFGTMPGMSKPRRKRSPKAVLRLPDLEQARSAVLNSLTSPSSQSAYNHAIRDFIDWYCSEPRLAFNKTVVSRYCINLEQAHYAASTISLQLAAVRRLACEAAYANQGTCSCVILPESDGSRATASAASAFDLVLLVAPIWRRLKQQKLAPRLRPP